MIEEVLNCKEASVILGVTADTVRRYVRQGQLKGYVHRGYRNRKEVRILTGDLKTFIACHFLEPYYPTHKKPAGLAKNILESLGISKGKKNVDD